MACEQTLDPRRLEQTQGQDATRHGRSHYRGLRLPLGRVLFLYVDNVIRARPNAN